MSLVTFTHMEAALMRNNKDKVAIILTNFNMDKFILHCSPGILNLVTTYPDPQNSEEFSVTDTRSQL